jgi:hypothetical protein
MIDKKEKDEAMIKEQCLIKELVKEKQKGEMKLK